MNDLPLEKERVPAIPVKMRGSLENHKNTESILFVNSSGTHTKILYAKQERQQNVPAIFFYI